MMWYMTVLMVLECFQKVIGRFASFSKLLYVSNHLKDNLSLVLGLQGHYCDASCLNLAGRMDVKYW